MANSSHLRASAPPATGVAVRARTIGRTSRQSSATLAALNAAAESTHTSSASIARAWGVDERIARDVRAGVRPLTAEKLDALPRELRVEFARRLVELAQDDAPASCAPVSRHVLEAVGATGRVAALAHDAEADGVVNDDELAAIEAAATTAVSRHARVISICRQRRTVR